ncbi:glycoside hydrolase family 31 protein [Fistulina hepatica ATCC 64428]|uniref:Glucosidase II subunit alpha n=1 Tax=Fistulina hepatica ATCC 64428 TaxID=1128425 RepID=A0A0D7A5U6_9AGAR|nr:glycoside hydrolase family 31 protein [Fistulina hepatica ATCC 64428]
MRGWSLYAFLFLFSSVGFAVKSQDFKTCSQSGFCRRGRALAERAKDAGDAWKSPYSVDPSSLTVSPDRASFMAAVESSLYPSIKFSLELRVHDDGVVRVRMDEVDGLHKRYDETASWVLPKEPTISRDLLWTANNTAISLGYSRGKHDDVDVVVTYNPLTIVMSKNGKPQIMINGRGLLHMEHYRSKDTPAVEGSDNAQAVLDTAGSRAWFEGDKEEDFWEEKFKSWTDKKPKGPESLSLDIDFPESQRLYGIPQHATRLDLPTTTGEEAVYSDPYRLYNADVFEYSASSPMSLYGSIPVLYAHHYDGTVGVFNAIGSETWIDVYHPSPRSSQTHWISESGILDVFLLPGPNPEDVLAQYGRLAGTQSLPPLWSLGYHQCRWNYVSSDDIRAVQSRFDAEDIPLDVLWLDIEYAEEHKYFMWDHKTFPDPVDMVNDLSAYGRKLVAIIDPHLKRTDDFPVYKEAQEKGVLVKSKNGESDYEGWCWSGSSSWLDMFNPKSWEWWRRLFAIDPPKQPEGWHWTQSTKDIHVWNDMNEPSIFNGPEITMEKDAVHYGGWEHRDVHNINGMLFANQTFKALEARMSPPERPFVLTRSFFAGSQRFGAMWTGDNLGTWEHMAVGIKMVLANGLGGFSFAGSDVGGFFGNPEPEMLVRWYQVGAFMPFFRAHAHIDTKRREPYLLDDPYKSIIRDTIRLRYAMLPVWYTAFWKASATGMPVLRPQFVMFPGEKNGFGIDDQFYVGDSILVKPVTEEGADETQVYLGEDEHYYDYFTYTMYRGAHEGRLITVPAALDQIPVFIRGGTIVPTRERHRRSVSLTKRDPFTLRVALDHQGHANGTLYLDDGDSYDYHEGGFIWREFAAKRVKTTITLSNNDHGARKPGEAVAGVDFQTYSPGNEFAQSAANVRVEKVVVLGLTGKPVSVTLGGVELAWEYTPGYGWLERQDGGKASVLTIKDPKVPIAKYWEIVITL